jgi:hypothetical protein
MESSWLPKATMTDGVSSMSSVSLTVGFQVSPNLGKPAGSAMAHFFIVSFYTSVVISPDMALRRPFVYVRCQSESYQARVTMACSSIIKPSQMHE